MIQVGRKCNVQGCEKIAVGKGLCGMHTMRQNRHGHFNSTRPNDWGSREKHELYGTYRTLTRTKKGDCLCPEWHDFWQFVKDVGEKKKGHYFLRIDKTKPYSKDNVYWSATTPNQQKNEYMQRWQAANPNYSLSRDLRRLYGITLEEYSRMWDDQKGVCKICGKAESSFEPKSGKNRKLAVDHCHATKKIRGLLCSKCNTALGNFKDDIGLLTKAIEYIKFHT